MSEPLYKRKRWTEGFLGLSALSWLKIEWILPAGADRGSVKYQVSWLQRHHFPRLCVCTKPQGGGLWWSWWVGRECLSGSWPSVWEQGWMRGYPRQWEQVLTLNDMAVGTSEWACDNGTKLGGHSYLPFSFIFLFLILSNGKQWVQVMKTQGTSWPSAETEEGPPCCP